MIKSFKCKQTEEFYITGRSRYFPPNILESALKKLAILNHARTLQGILVTPSMRLEKFQGPRSHEWKIRVNKQWRISFQWDGENVQEVQMEDYH